MLEQRTPPSSSTIEVESNWRTVVEMTAGNRAIVATVVRDCT